MINNLNLNSSPRAGVTLGRARRHGFAPVVMILAVASRMRDAGCSFGLCLSNMVAFAREEVEERNQAAEVALAVDDPIEEVRGTLELALANDPAEVRARVLGAFEETHRRTVELRQQLRVEVPESVRG
jgi:hypothetical protein